VASWIKHRDVKDTHVPLLFRPALDLVVFDIGVARLENATMKGANMARKATTTQEKPVHVLLLDGFDVHSRPNGSVHTIKLEGKTVAEICVGTKKTRLNLRSAPKPAPRNLTLDGKSKSWPGGGVIVTPDNVAAARAVLTAATAAPKQAKAA
jgi:hypothetical protein